MLVAETHGSLRGERLCISILSGSLWATGKERNDGTYPRRVLEAAASAELDIDRVLKALPFFIRKEVAEYAVTIGHLVSRIFVSDEREISPGFGGRSLPSRMGTSSALHTCLQLSR